MSEIWSRRNLIATVVVTIVVGVLGAAATLLQPVVVDYWNQERSQDVQSENVPTLQIGSGEQDGIDDQPQRPAEDSSTRVDVSMLHVSEVALDIPAVFELEIVVSGFGEARDFSVTLNFGRAQIDACDFQPKTAVAKVIADERSYRRFMVNSLRPKEKLYVRCLMDAPVFDQVVIEGGNISFDKVIRFVEYHMESSSKRMGSIGFWVFLLRAFVTVILLVVLVCICIIIWRFAELLVAGIG